MLDLADTIFFVLRKKANQVTPLHVTHHSIMPFTAWVAFKYAPIPASGMVLILNTFVHTVMYAYYHLASLGHPVPWKRVITLIQIAQFYVCLLHAIHTLAIPGCNFPPWIATLQAAESLFFIISFSRFYVAAYRDKRK